MKKLFSVLALAGALTVGLTGCAPGVSATQTGTEESDIDYPPEHYVFQQEMPDGSFVNCVWAKEGRGGGLSCDFDNPVTEF